jgi:hypothetical protein
MSDIDFYIECMEKIDENYIHPSIDQKHIDFYIECVERKLKELNDTN